MAVARRMAHENVTAGNGLRRAIFSFRLGGYPDRRRELPLRRLASHESMDRLARRGTNPPKNASTFAPVLLPLFVDAQCGTNRCLWAKLSTRSSRDTSLLGVSMVSRGTSATSAMVGVGDASCTLRPWTDSGRSRACGVRRGCEAHSRGGSPEASCGSTPDLTRYARSACAVSALPGPEEAEPTPVPRDDGRRLQEDERRSPLGPDPREPDPE